MGRIELDGAAWRAVGEPIGERAARALVALTASVPGTQAAADAARLIGADHLPLASLVAVLAASRSAREAQIAELLGASATPSPFVVGLSGGVAVGKTLTADALAALLREQLGLTATVVTTDGFLLPNAELEAQGLMSRKGFPETYDRAALVAFLEGLGSGRDDLVVPEYDHLASDVLVGRGREVGRPDVVVLEGVNVLQPALDPTSRSVSDHLHFSVYVDADPELMHAWFTTRLLHLRSRPAGEVPSYFAPMAGFTDDEFVAMTDAVWEHVNLPNLVEHIEPTRARADLVLVKGEDHVVRQVIITP
jgi:type I pantothenate kinase